MAVLNSMSTMYRPRNFAIIVGVIIVVGCVTIYLLAGSQEKEPYSLSKNLLNKRDKTSQESQFSQTDLQELQPSHHDPHESQSISLESQPSPPNSRVSQPSHPHSQESQPSHPDSQVSQPSHPSHSGSTKSQLDSQESQTSSLGAVDSEILELSEHPDIDVRGKFQKARIEEFCRNRFSQQTFPTNRNSIYFHLLFSDEQKVLYCYVPKVGCTNMKRLIFYMSGNLPLDTVDEPIIDHEKYIFPAQRNASFLSKTLTTAQREKKISTYYKFMIVRNPLERLLSAYRDKIEYPLLSFGSEKDYPESVKFEILSRERPQELKKWQEARKLKKPFNISVTFPEFCHYVTSTKSQDLDDHFMPSVDLCYPCLIRYDFYGNFRNYSTDSAELIKKFKTNPKFYQNKSFHKPQNETRLLLHKYYQQLNNEERTKLLEKLYDELLFYYTLYPSERNSHQELLGIDTPVLTL